jgi:hypothetical protein
VLLLNIASCPASPAAAAAFPPAAAAAAIALQTRDSIMWWYPVCRWGANYCSQYKWGWLCGLTLQYCQVSGVQDVTN